MRDDRFGSKADISLAPARIESGCSIAATYWVSFGDTTTRSFAVRQRGVGASINAPEPGIYGLIQRAKWCRWLFVGRFGY